MTWMYWLDRDGYPGCVTQPTDDRKSGGTRTSCDVVASLEPQAPTPGKARAEGLGSRLALLVVYEKVGGESQGKSGRALHTRAFKYALPNIGRGAASKQPS